MEAGAPLRLRTRGMAMKDGSMRIGKWAATAVVAAALAGFAPGPERGFAPGGAALAQSAPLGGTIQTLSDGSRIMTMPDGRRFLLPAPAPQTGSWPPAPTQVYAAPQGYAPPQGYAAPTYAAPAPAVYAAPTYAAPTYAAPTYAAPTYVAPTPSARPAAAPAPASAAPRMSTPSGGFAPSVLSGGPYTTSTHVSRRESDQSSGFNPADPSMYVTTQNGRTPVPPTIELNIAHATQEQPLWCWAAAAQQALGWANRGHAPAQCEIVARVHGLDAAACCADPKGVCNLTGEIPEIIQLIRSFGGKAETAPVPRQPKPIFDAVAKGQTMLIRLRPQPREQAVGIRHMIVVRGVEWFRMPNGRLQATLLYNDPLGDDQRGVAFDEIVGFFEQAMVASP